MAPEVAQVRGRVDVPRVGAADGVPVAVGLALDAAPQAAVRAGLPGRRRRGRRGRGGRRCRGGGAGQARGWAVSVVHGVGEPEAGVGQRRLPAAAAAEHLVGVRDKVHREGHAAG